MTGDIFELVSDDDMARLVDYSERRHRKRDGRNPKQTLQGGTESRVAEGSFNR
jgi:hypothetical protein